MLRLDGTKLLWHRKRLEKWLRGERIYPITVDCALTRACNYKCEYCYGGLHDSKGAMTKYDIERFINESAELGIKGMSLVSDGESTCHPNFEDAIKLAHKNKISIAVGTNGVLLPRFSLHSILPKLTYLRFNISAAQKKLYNEIHGAKNGDFERLKSIVKWCTEYKRKHKLKTTIGLQMVFLPKYKNQVIPLAHMGKDLGVDYLIIKHCSDDEKRSLNVDYDEIRKCRYILKQAEAYGEKYKDYSVVVKWGKMKDGNKRKYKKCYAASFFLQFSGTGLLAPCGMFFHSRFKHYHFGSIQKDGIKKALNSDRYKAVIDHLASDKFDARVECGYLCIQHDTNNLLWDMIENSKPVVYPTGEKPEHVNFI